MTEKFDPRDYSILTHHTNSDKNEKMYLSEYFTSNAVGYILTRTNLTRNVLGLRRETIADETAYEGTRAMLNALSSFNENTGRTIPRIDRENLKASLSTVERDTLTKQERELLST